MWLGEICNKLKFRNYNYEILIVIKYSIKADSNVSYYINNEFISWGDSYGTSGQQPHSERTNIIISTNRSFTFEIANKKPDVSSLEALRYRRIGTNS